MRGIVFYLPIVYVLPGLVVVSYLDVIHYFVCGPNKTDAVLIVDSNTLLTHPVFL